MWTVIGSICSGLLVGILTLIGTILTNNKNQAITNTKIEENNKMTNYKIDQLKIEVEKHNKVVERVYKVEERLDSLDHFVNKMHK